MKTPLHRNHDEATINSLRKDPQFAAEYLNAILEDGDQQELLTALRYLAAAFGGVPYLAEQAELNATTLYRTLSPRGNPELKSLLALLKALGLRLAVQPSGQQQCRKGHMCTSKRDAVHRSRRWLSRLPCLSVACLVSAE